MVYNWLKNARYLLYPGECRLCLSKALNGLELCSQCLADLPTIDFACRSCARPLSSGAGETCGKCLQSTPAITRCFSLYAYQYPVDGIVQRIKFRRDLALIHSMGALMAKHIIDQNQAQADVILPVPLHRKRLFTRGYNQSIELARPIQNATGIPIDNTLCKRIIHTEAQSLLPASQRRKNIRGAFKIARKIDNTHIVIVDDVMSTGSTLNELANALLKAGARQVDAWVLARSVFH
ncbi:MAG: ComF family protein [Gammaproteobacteria bacterium]